LLLDGRVGRENLSRQRGKRRKGRGAFANESTLIFEKRKGEKKKGKVDLLQSLLRGPFPFPGEKKKKRKKKGDALQPFRKKRKRSSYHHLMPPTHSGFRKKKEKKETPQGGKKKKGNFPYLKGEMSRIAFQPLPEKKKRKISTNNTY